MPRAVFGSSQSLNNGWSIEFDVPIRTFTIHDLEQLPALLNSAEAEARDGFWVALMLSYEAAPAFDRALRTHVLDSFPLAWAAVFAEPSVTSLKFTGNPAELSDWEPRITAREYYEAVNRIQELIAQGDTYQVNYTFPLVTNFNGDSRAWYDALCRVQSARYCAYLDLERYKILSLSPELFFERRGDLLRTKPMKGTIRRGRWAAEDQKLSQTLKASPKDRAENVMIVDLLRNDMGKVSVPGSVKVSSLFAVERMETLWQMTSEVESTLTPGTTLLQVFAALFPCGSITGAPKIRTMEIIRELEILPRGPYTGTIGLLSPGGDCIFNVAIRTLVLDSETGIATFGVGGGITSDSTAQAEYEECLLKSSFLNTRHSNFQLLETLLLENGAFYLLNRHLDRLRTSANYFDFCYPEAEILAELNRIANVHSVSTWKTRLLLSKGGEIACEAIQFDTIGHLPMRVAIATKPVDSSNRFLFHKTTNRAVYDNAIASRPDCDDVILWNQMGEITESTVANIVVSINGALVTPPQASGLLSGTLRAELLSQGKIFERVVSVEELKRAQHFSLINSVHKWREAILID